MTHPPIPHRPGCDTTATKLRTGNLGDTLVTCTGCGRFGVVPAEQAPDEPGPEEPSQPTTHYVCPQHQQSVTWRGTGCSACATARHDARAARRGRRAAARDEDDPREVPWTQ